MPPSKGQILAELKTERDGFLALMSSLSPADWRKATQLKGWSVHDVAAHLYGNCAGEFDEAFRRCARGDASPVIPGDLNIWNEARARAVSDWPPDRLLDAYKEASAATIALIDGWNTDLETPVRLAEALLPRPLWLEARILAVHHWVHGQDIRKAVGRPGGVTDERMRPVIQSLFDMMPLVFRRDEAGGLCMTVGFELSGPGGGQWTVDVSDGECRVSLGRPEGAAVTIKGDAWTYYRVGQGLMSPLVAILTRKFVPVGNPLTALRFARLFRTGKAAVNRAASVEPTLS